MAEKKKKTVPRAFIVWFSTNIYSPAGQKILDAQDAKNIILSHGGIEKWAIGYHDNDTHDEESIKHRESHHLQTYMEAYKREAKANGIAIDPDATEAEIEAGTKSGFVFDKNIYDIAKAEATMFYPPKQVGDSKEIHIHVLMKFKNKRYIDSIASWFGVPMNMIEIPRGRGAFEDCAEYLVHAKQPEKAQYDPHDIISNFDYPEWLENQKFLDILHEKYRLSEDEVNDVIDHVANRGLSLEEAEERVSTAVFLQKHTLFKKARDKYLYEKAEMPIPRLVFYVDGKGSGIGKTLASKALCKQFAKGFGADISKDFESLKRFIYKLGDKGVAWDKYDGQPIVFIDDRTAGDMLKEFNGHDGVKNLLEMFPQKETKSIKFSNTTVIAQFIVISGIQPYEEFVKGLNGTYTTKDGKRIQSDSDITQYTRRITGIIRVDEDYITALFNKGVLNDTREFAEYEALAAVRLNLRQMGMRLKGSALAAVEEKAFLQVVDKTQEILDRQEEKIENPEDIPQEMLDYGTIIDDGQNRNITIPTSNEPSQHTILDDVTCANLPPEFRKCRGCGASSSCKLKVGGDDDD